MVTQKYGEDTQFLRNPTFGKLIENEEGNLWINSDLIITERFVIRVKKEKAKMIY